MAAETAAGVVRWEAAIALMGRPPAMSCSSCSSSGVRPPPLIGATIASAIAGSSIEPPAATDRTAVASCSPWSTRSLSR